MEGLKTFFFVLVILLSCHACVIPIISLSLFSVAPPVANPMEQRAHSSAAFPSSLWEQASQLQAVSLPSMFSEESIPRKKKYAKEAWPGKKTPQNLLV